jgi:hypothetical protein
MRPRPCLCLLAVKATVTLLTSASNHKLKFFPFLEWTLRWQAVLRAGLVEKVHCPPDIFG